MERGTVNRAITVTRTQDAFMEQLAARKKWSRSQTYREVIARYMQAAFFVDSDMPEGQELMASGARSN